MWFNILKIQETITDLGIDFDLPEKVESKRDCCEKFVKLVKEWKETYTMPEYAE